MADSGPAQEPVPVKKVWIAYMLLFLGGGFGLHLWYLGRPLQCALWSLTGAVFGLGWLYDLLAIPRYTEEVNFLSGTSSSSFRMIQERKLEYGRPSVGIMRFLALCMFGGIFALPAKFALPEESPELFQKTLVVAGQALGLWCVANCPSLETADFTKILFCCAVGSFSGTISDLLLPPDSSLDQMLQFLAAVCPIAGLIHFSSQCGPNLQIKLTCCLNSGTIHVTSWKKEMKPTSLLKDFLLVMLVLSLFGVSSLLGLYHHGEITTEEGERLRFKDVFHDAMHPDLWKEIRHCFMSGNCWQEFTEHVAEGFELDGGRGKAYKALGLENGAPMEEIKAKYRTLVLQNHPDKCVSCSDEEKAAKSAKFMEIQQAYKLLSREPEEEF